MPGKSSREDRNEGTMDRAKGRMKEAGGAVTGDKDKKSEGRSDQRKAKAKDKKAAAKDLLKPRTCSSQGPAQVTPPRAPGPAAPGPGTGAAHPILGRRDAEGDGALRGSTAGTGSCRRPGDSRQGAGGLRRGYPV